MSNPFDWKSEALRSLVQGLTAGTTALGLYGLFNLIHQLQLRSQQALAYKKLPKYFPEVANIPEPVRKQIFRSIAMLHPTVATNPWIAGSLVARMYAAQYMPPDLIKELTEADPRKRLLELARMFVR